MHICSSPDPVGTDAGAARPVLPRGDDLQVDVDVEDDEAEGQSIVSVIKEIKEISCISNIYG